MPRTRRRANRAATRRKAPRARRAASRRTASRRSAASRRAAGSRRPARAKRAGARRRSPLNQTAYSVSDELQAVVGAKRLTRPQIIKQFWRYVKAHKCQDANNRRLIVPDHRLAEVIGKKPVDMMKLAGILNKHIQ